jgi:uncharacterized protein YjcR
MARNNDRLNAKRLYIEENKEISDIALQLDVPEKTVYRWRAEEGWDKDRETMKLTGVSAYKNMMLIAVRQLEEMATSGEIDARKADALNKVIKAAKSLSKDIDKRGNILLGVGEFVTFMREEHSEFLMTLVPYLTEFGTWVKHRYP